MSINELLTEYVEHDGSIDRSDEGFVQHIFVSSTLDAAEKIYKELTYDDIYEAYEEYKEDSDSELDEAELIGCSICLNVYELFVEASIALLVESDLEQLDLDGVEVKLNAELTAILLEKTM